jgi:BASS family bile acid:Na+ symporter
LEIAARTIIPAAVFFLMWIVGLDLTARDFRRVVAFPKSVFAGTAGQFVLLPILGGALILLLRPEPVFTAGIILIAAAPSGSISNLLTLLARGNVGLSVTVTALSNAIGVVTYPLLAAAGFALFLGQRADIGIPVGPMMGQLVLLMLVPIGLGMVVRFSRPDFVERRRASLQRLSLLVVALVVAIVALDQRAFLAAHSVRVAVLSTLLTVPAMGIGWGVGSAMRLPIRDRISFLMEFSARNTAIGIVVASTTLGRLDYAAFILTYFVSQMVITLIVIAALRTAPARPNSVERE